MNPANKKTVCKEMKRTNKPPTKVFYFPPKAINTVPGKMHTWPMF